MYPASTPWILRNAILPVDRLQIGREGPILWQAREGLHDCISATSDLHLNRNQSGYCFIAFRQNHTLPCVFNPSQNIPHMTGCFSGGDDRFHAYISKLQKYAVNRFHKALQCRAPSGKHWARRSSGPGTRGMLDPN
jgi:hypothetical protein